MTPCCKSRFQIGLKVDNNGKRLCLHQASINFLLGIIGGNDYSIFYTKLYLGNSDYQVNMKL